MKKIEAIIRPTKVGDVYDALDAAGFPGLMLTEIEGHGRQKMGHTPKAFSRRRDQSHLSIPRIRRRRAGTVGL